MKIASVGDSFSISDHADSWVSQIAKTHTVLNFSQRGISEYRLYTIVKDHLAEIVASDRLILFHTNPDRVFIPDTVKYPPRNLPSHPHSDMVANDSLSNRSWHNIAETYYRYFFDSSMQLDFYDLLINDIVNLTSSIPTIHCTGFDITSSRATLIHSFFNTLLTSPGDINHFDAQGNSLVYNYIGQQL